MLLTTISLGTAGIYAVLGLSVVFFGLILLMIVVTLLGKVFTATQKESVPVIAEKSPPAPPKTAPGTAGELKIHNVEPKTAAMLMAIVADKMGKPLNELRFTSIREVSE